MVPKYVEVQYLNAAQRSVQDAERCLAFVDREQSSTTPGDLRSELKDLTDDAHKLQRRLDRLNIDYYNYLEGR